MPRKKSTPILHRIKNELKKYRLEGFTLIELLVVTSIISLLSSMVLASVVSAKERAVNISLVSQVKEVEKILALYVLDHDALPNVSETSGGFDYNGNHLLCAGLNCIHGTGAGSVVNESMTDPGNPFNSYMPDGIYMGRTITFNNGNWTSRGIIYYCPAGSWMNHDGVGNGGSCTDVWLLYPIYGSPSKCLNGTYLTTDNGQEHTICRLIPNSGSFNY